MIYNETRNSHNQYINAIVSVYEDNDCSWAVDGKRMELLERNITVNFPNYMYPPEEDTFEFEYESLDELKDMEDGKVYSIFMEVEIITTRDYWGECSGDIEIIELKYKDITDKYKENEKYFQLEE